ncbi:hypothetical protein TNCT_69661 [Trichonephila clavata]|uniref:Uncharacterized protein n=1 Tax=Trichonephila clavata TaxID=2740835 RepID=A0A8X6IJ47_TRICU|nr:hypothetical protein TNCT_69661 [Trichonephila clavata]
MSCLVGTNITLPLSPIPGGRVLVRPSRVNQNSRPVGYEFYSEYFHRPMNVVPCRKEHYATPPPIPGGRVLVRPSHVNQNSTSVGPEFCSEHFHTPMNVVPCRKEYYATPPHIPGGRVSV